MKNVRSVASDGQTVWAATSGGIFRFNPVDSTYQKFVNSDGLSSNDVTSIFIDAAGRIWIGQQSGNIDLYDPVTKRWRYITDIALSAKVNRAINSFYQNGDNLYIASAFGVMVFSISKFEFSDTYTSFDQNIFQPNVASVRIFQNRIFCATSSGMIASNTGAVNLADPKSWSVFLPAVTTGKTFSEFNGSLFASTASGLLKFQSNSWSVANGIASAVNIVAAADTALLFTEGTALRSLNAANILSTLSSAIPSATTSGTLTSNRIIFLGFSSNGIGAMNSQSQWNIYYPNGPNSNAFFQLVVDENGELWSASGGYTAGSGFYRFNGSAWKNYTTSNTPLLLTNDCFAIALGPNNSKWISTWGEGLMLVNRNGDVVKRFDYAQNTPAFPGFVGVVRSGGVPSYIVPSKVAMDRSENIWVSVFLSLDNNKALWKMKPDSSWEAYPGSPYGSSPSFMHGIVIDQTQTKWFTNTVHGRAPNSSTIVYFNESKNSSDWLNGWGTISNADGATDTQTQAIEVDRDGTVWIGTGIGITIISNPNSPKNKITKVFLDFIQDQYINCIAVDAENNKWIGTRTKGVFVVSSDGRYLLNQYSVDNTGGKLVDNNVISIAFDKKKGIAYFGTDKGLSSLEIPATITKNAFTTIDLSPNPVYLPGTSSVEISGLVEESTIKVLTLNGKVIKQFPAQGGGRAFWDCRDNEGRMVSSGIYIIVAHNRAGDKSASAKVAVIQR